MWVKNSFLTLSLSLGVLAAPVEFEAELSVNRAVVAEESDVKIRSEIERTPDNADFLSYGIEATYEFLLEDVRENELSLETTLSCSPLEWLEIDGEVKVSFEDDEVETELGTAVTFEADKGTLSFENEHAYRYSFSDKMGEYSLSGMIDWGKDIADLFELHAECEVTFSIDPEEREYKIECGPTLEFEYLSYYIEYQFDIDSEREKEHTVSVGVEFEL